MRKALKRAIAYGIYYIIFIGVTIYGTIRGWPLRIPILLVFLILLYACVGGKSNAITEYRYHTDNPMIAPDLPIQPERSSASVSFLASFLLLLPPYFVEVLDTQLLYQEFFLFHQLQQFYNLF